MLHKKKMREPGKSYHMKNLGTGYEAKIKLLWTVISTSYYHSADHKFLLGESQMFGVDWNGPLSHEIAIEIPDIYWTPLRTYYNNWLFRGQLSQL